MFDEALEFPRYSEGGHAAHSGHHHPGHVHLPLLLEELEDKVLGRVLRQPDVPGGELKV